MERRFGVVFRCEKPETQKFFLHHLEHIHRYAVISLKDGGRSLTCLFPGPHYHTFNLNVNSKILPPYQQGSTDDGFGEM